MMQKRFLSFGNKDVDGHYHGSKNVAGNNFDVELHTGKGKNILRHKSFDCLALQMVCYMVYNITEIRLSVSDESSRGRRGLGKEEGCVDNDVASKGE